MRYGRVFRLLAATLLIAGAAQPVAAADKSFNVATGDWTVDGNWTPPGVPGEMDSVTISNGRTAQLNAAGVTTVAALTLSGGTLSGSGTLTVTGTLAWTGGTMSGSGTTNVQTTLTLTSNATMSLTDTRTLNNGGTATWAGASPFTVAAGATVVNRPNATFTIQTSADFNSTGTFVNQGMVVKMAGSGDGITRVAGAFNNSGAVKVESGALELDAGGTQTGSFTAANGARLQFGGGTHTLNGVALSGAGTVDWGGGTSTFTSGTYDVTGTTMVSGGTMHVWSAAVTVAAVGDIVVSNGTLVLNSGEEILARSYTQNAGTVAGTDTVTIDGMMTWTGGTLAGSGTTNANGGLTLTTNATALLIDTHTLNNAGAATWAGGFPVGIAAGATLANLSSGTFTIQTSADLSTTGTFANHGMVVKIAGSGDGITRCVGAFNNSGTVSVQSGALELDGGGTQTGSFTVANGARLQFGGGAHTLDGAALSGAGTVDWGGGATVFPNGTYDVTGTTLVSGGAMHAWSPAVSVVAVGDLVVSAGTLLLNSGEVIRPRTYEQSGGILAGSDTITVDGAFTWMGGTIGGSGTTNANGGITLTTNTTASLGDTRTLNNAAMATWAGAFPISIAAGARLVNLPTGTFTIQTSADFNSTGTFANQGTVVKMAGSGDGITRFAGAFTNSGTVDIAGGVLDVSGGFTQSAGATRLDGGALSSTRTIEIDGGRLEGGGTVTGNVVVANSGELSPGLSPGLLAITGTYTQHSGGMLTIEIGGHTAGSQFDKLAVSGAATLGGTLAVHLTDGFTPTLADAFEIMTFGSRSGDFATDTGLVVSTGLGFRKTFAATTLTLQFGQEICDDGQDNDGDGRTDCADPKCADFLPCTFTPTATGTATATPMVTHTATPSATATATATNSPTPLASPTPSTSPSPTPTSKPACVGDCNTNRVVTIDELIRGVNIALATVDLNTCSAVDASHNGSVEINELITAVSNALNGCPGAATPTAPIGSRVTGSDPAAGALAWSGARCRGRGAG